jgi:hypothetical protein
VSYNILERGNNMIKRFAVPCLLVLLLFTGSALAIGPVELMVYGGPTVSALSGGYDLGASAMIDLPMIPKVGVEFERSAMAGDTSLTKLGLAYSQTIIPFLASVKVSAGSSSITSSVAASIVGPSASASGSYVSAGAVIKVLSLAINPKFVYNQYGSVSVSEGIINAGLTF